MNKTTETADVTPPAPVSLPAVLEQARAALLAHEPPAECSPAARADMRSAAIDAIDSYRPEPLPEAVREVAGRLRQLVRADALIVNLDRVRELAERLESAAPAPPPAPADREALAKVARLAWHAAESPFDWRAVADAVLRLVRQANPAPPAPANQEPLFEQGWTVEFGPVAGRIRVWIDAEQWAAEKDRYRLLADVAERSTGLATRPTSYSATAGVRLVQPAAEGPTGRADEAPVSDTWPAPVEAIVGDKGRPHLARRGSRRLDYNELRRVARAWNSLIDEEAGAPVPAEGPCARALRELTEAANDALTHGTFELELARRLDVALAAARSALAGEPELEDTPTARPEQEQAEQVTACEELEAMLRPHAEPGESSPDTLRRLLGELESRRRRGEKSIGRGGGVDVGAVREVARVLRARGRLLEDNGGWNTPPSFFIAEADRLDAALGGAAGEPLIDPQTGSPYAPAATPDPLPGYDADLFAEEQRREQRHWDLVALAAGSLAGLRAHAGPSRDGNPLTDSRLAHQAKRDAVNTLAAIEQAEKGGGE